MLTVERTEQSVRGLIEEATARQQSGSFIRHGVSAFVARRYRVENFWPVANRFCDPICESLGWHRLPSCPVTMRLQMLKNTEGVVKCVHLCGQRIPGGQVLDLTPLTEELPEIPVIELVALVFLMDGRAVWLTSNPQWDEDFLKDLQQQVGRRPLAC
jgi:hypothetical protein